METPKTTFRLDTDTLALMDKLVKFPTPSLIDRVEGAPRSRAELIRRLVKIAAGKKGSKRRVG